MESDVMTHVDEQGATSPYPTGKGDGIVDELMGVMGLHEAQGIDHQDLRALRYGSSLSWMVFISVI